MYDSRVTDHSDAGVGLCAMNHENCRQQQKGACKEQYQSTDPRSLNLGHEHLE